MSPRKTEHSDTELRYFKLRQSGMNSLQAIGQLRLSEGSRDRLEGFYRASTMMVSNRDSSCPAFSHDDAHVGAVSAVGGYPRGTPAGPVRPDGRPWVTA